MGLNGCVLGETRLTPISWATQPMIGGRAVERPFFADPVGIAAPKRRRAQIWRGAVSSISGGFRLQVTAWPEDGCGYLMLLQAPWRYPNILREVFGPAQPMPEMASAGGGEL